MKVIICGGAGFVGQHVVRRLTAEGHECRIYDRVLPKEGPGICGDIHDLELLTQWMRGSDLVFHLASNADISRSAADPTVDFREGTELTQNVLEAMRVTGVKRLVYFSGSGVYGNVNGKIFREDHSPMLPISTYGASKLASEAMISAYCFMFGIQARVFRPANIVGPGQTHGVALDFVRRLKADPTRLRVLGDGFQKKSYIHIDDILDAIWAAINCEWEAFETFNLASDDCITVREIAGIAMHLMETRDCLVQCGPEDRGWNGDVPRINLDCSKIKALGWKPQSTSAQAITNAIASML